MSLGIERCENHLVAASIGDVVYALTSLILHDFALKIELRLVHCRKQETHSVGIEPQCKRKSVRREILVVVRSVFSRRAVVICSRCFELLVEHSRRDMLGPHEHDVLEEVCKSGSACLLVTGTDLVPRVDRDDWRGVVLVKNYLEAVRKRVFLELDLGNRLGLCNACCAPNY